jgi:hypothetical protein
LSIINPIGNYEIYGNYFSNCLAGGLSISGINTGTYMNIEENTFTNGLNDVTILSSEHACLNTVYEIQFISNSFSNSSGMYAIHVGEEGSPQVASNSTVPSCSYLFDTNTFTTNNVHSDALISVSTIGTNFIRNTFGTNNENSIVSYDTTTNYPYSVPLNFTYNDWNTLDFRVITSKIQMGQVLYNPIYDSTSKKYFDTERNCYINGNLCIQNYDCYGIVFDDNNVCGGNGKCIASNVCDCYSGRMGSLCQYIACNGYNASDSRVCSGHGDCIDANVCNCSSGYFGDTCGVSDDIEPSVFPDVSSSVPLEETSSSIPTITSSLSKSSYDPFPTVTSSSVLSNTETVIVSDSSSSTISSTAPITCFGIVSTDNSVCSGKGICMETDWCDCYESYRGLQCNETNSDQSNIIIQFTSNNINGRVFNRGKQLYATANISPVDKVSEMDMFWELYRAPNTLLDIYSYISSGLSVISRSIVLKEYSLQAGTEYLLVFNIKYREKDTGYTRSTILVKTSSPLTAGTFSVEPDTGFAYNTTFSLQANNWQSNSGNLIYSFGYVTNNAKITLVSNRSLSFYDTILPAGYVDVFVVASVLYGEQSQLFRSVTIQSANAPVLDFVQDKLKTINSTSDHFDSDVTLIVSAIKDSAGTWNQTVAMNIIDSVVQSVEQRVNNSLVAPEIQIQTLRVITDNVGYFTAATLDKVTTILTTTIQHLLDTDNDETLSSIVTATKNLAAPLLDKSSSNHNKESFVQLVNAFSPLIRKTLIEGHERSLSFDNSELLYLHSSRTPTTSVVLNIPEPNQEDVPSRRRLTNNNVEIILSDELFTSAVMANVPSLQVVGSIYTNPIYEYEESNVTTIVSSTVALSLYDSATDQKLSVNDISSTFTSVIPVIMTTENRTQYVCKYWDSDTATWSNSSICTTTQPTIIDSVVICNCSKPVTHLVSLDYIQAVTEEDEESPTPNPKSPRKLGTAGIVLIILACLTPFVVMIFIAIAIIWYIIDFNKRSKSEIYSPNQLDVIIQMLCTRMIKRQHAINL